MGKVMLNIGDKVVIESAQLQQLIAALHNRGYEVIAPTVQEGNLVYEAISLASQLPQGWTDKQEPGNYEFVNQHHLNYFGFVSGSHTWKQFLHPPRLRYWQAEKTDNGFLPTQPETESPMYAFIGVRACELKAIAIQDRVFLQGNYVDPFYLARREKLFIVAVNCTVTGGNCFCVSMQSGPQASSGFDLALTEIIEETSHYFLVEIGSENGGAVIEELDFCPAEEAELEAAAQLIEKTATQMGRELDTNDIKELFYRNYENPRWNEVASRCLTCGNCTMVCPTCFCTGMQDTTDLTGQRAERWRKWDSCFSVDFSHIHGGSLRTSIKARYRQWLTHKLATWQDQFGTSGCVGCGRCITWCPVGIDLTEEVRAIRQSETEAQVGDV
jgi:ferredoxin